MGDRLTRQDWIRHGLRTLANEGPGALKVGPMSTQLKVSRGSFYWHFRDLADFRAELLRSWEEVATDRIIRDLEARSGEPDRLRQLLQAAFSSRRRLERAMRIWATQDEAVAKVVAAVDARRIKRLAGLLTDAGVAGARATHRARFLYWAYLGQPAVMDAGASSIPAPAFADLTRLFET